MLSPVTRSVSEFAKKPFAFLAVCALILNLVLEMLSRHSVTDGFMFIFKNPVGFLFGTAIIALSFIPTLFTKRKFALTALISAIWITVGVINFIVLCYRITPFSATDMLLVKSLFSLIHLYMNWWQITVIVLLILGVLAAVILMFFRMPKVDVGIKNNLLSSGYIAVIFALSFFSALQSGAVHTKFTNLGDAYKSYGFTYCFSASVFSRGIARPGDYSQETMKEIQSQLDEVLSKPKKEYSSVEDPNIILVQLESFFDVNYLRDIKYSQNPVPNFTELKKSCSSGFLTVPSIGAGTANTEFEVLTGMDKEYFGIGEYPYKTILQNKSCESICYNLKSSDYACHAIHNHYGTFYDRNIIFRNLGFDTFTPVEYMTNVPITSLGWEKDEVLLKYIDACLESDEARDFVFAISVQGHGVYPSTMPEGYTPTVKITSAYDDEARKNQIEYYVNMMYETDKFIGDLISAYSDYDEPVMVILYGDHLPNIELDPDDITAGELTQTEYVIWTNYELKTEDKDLTSYQLSAHIMNLCNKTDGVLTKVHQSYMDGESELDTEQYAHMMEMIEYDMLYGSDYLTSGSAVYEPPEELILGIYDITVNGVVIQPDEESGTYTTLINGDNFNIWSVVYINGKEVRTVYKNEHTLIIEATELEPGDSICVAQVTKERETLSLSNEYVITDKIAVGK